jgi:hypothetical protein
LILGENDGLNVRPHPGLLPRGEGETFAASLEIATMGLAGEFFVGRKSGCGLSSPWGEETGEGSRENKWIGADAKRSRKNSSRICKPASGTGENKPS